MKQLPLLPLALVTLLSLTAPTSAQDEGGAPSADELAKQLANPISSLVSVPFQNNFDFGFNDDEGFRYLLNFQPVIPISLNEDWNLIQRTIIPFIHQDDVILGTEQTGLGDTLASFFFSPAQPTDSGITWGAGPVLALPTATDNLLGSEKLGLGPTFVILRQDGKLTYGALANHVWSVAGDGSRDEVSATFLQPFFVVAAGPGATIALNTEAAYDWEREQWNIPVNLAYNKVFQLGSQMMQWQIGARYHAETPEGGPDWGFRAGLTFLFPK